VFKGWSSIQRTLLCVGILLLNIPTLSRTKQDTIRGGSVDADNPRIQYVGRFDFTNPKKVAFDWPGIQITTKFEGTSCFLRLEDHGNEYAVIVDHHLPRILTTDSTTTIYLLASGLVDSLPHTVSIQKRTESFIGRGVFLGFILDRGKTLLVPNPRPDRRIEFIGNSITSGYGVEGETATVHFTPQTENACMSYAAMTARALSADYSLVSFSGRGVVRNYGDSNSVSVAPMPALYGRVCYSDTIHQWDFSRWIPQVVVLNLGTNDYSTQPYPPKEVFQNAYRHLIDRVRRQYPGVAIFCISGPMIGEPCTGYIQELVLQEQRKKREKDVFFIGINPETLTNADWGSDHHPNIMGSEKMCTIIVSAIKLWMNW
jgi:lysophospholipase L1-like esterase